VPCISALDASVEVIPVIEHTQAQAWFLTDIDILDGLKCLHQAQKMECSVERANV
jgi:hypothetical protein